MKRENIEYSPIGIIKTPFSSKEGMPIQPSGASGIIGTIELFNDFVEGLKDLDGFSHIILIYHLHEAKDYKLMVKPFMDNELRGVFSTRAPKRPNSIGLSVVKLNKIEGNILYIENIDVLNNTPLLDIKPFIPDVDSPAVEKLGWLQNKSDQMKEKKSDNRFK
jgi:tRNA-Thr(GGU) m(6)t(6)A37 methyltransferase TsaA